MRLVFDLEMELGFEACVCKIPIHEFESTVFSWSVMHRNEIPLNSILRKPRNRFMGCGST